MGRPLYLRSKVKNYSLFIWSQSSSNQDQLEASEHPKKLASLGEMSSAIVHEIRNLAVIVGQVSLAEENSNEEI